MPITTALSATVMVNGKKVPLNAGDVQQIAKTGVVVFRLTDPTLLGNPGAFITWLHDEFGLDVSMPTGLPAPLQSAIDGFMDAQIILDTLTVDQIQKFYQFGVSFHLDPPLSLVHGLEFEGIGLLVTKQYSNTPLTNQNGLSKTDVTVLIDKNAAAGVFANAKKVQIDSETMPVTAVDPTGKLTVTRDPASAATHSLNTPVVLIDPDPAS